MINQFPILYIIISGRVMHLFNNTTIACSYSPMFNRTHTPFGAGMQLWRKQSGYFEKYKTELPLVGCQCLNCTSALKKYVNI